MGLFDNFLTMYGEEEHEDDPEEKQAFFDKYTTDLTKMYSDGGGKLVIGREKEIERIIEILCRKTKNNPVLVGEAGVGKTSIVGGLALAIANQNVPSSLLKKRILSLNVTSLVSGAIYRGDMEARIEKLVRGVKADKDIILFIDELHTIIGAGNPRGELDVASILKTPLSAGDIQVIGATTTKEYSRYVENESALARCFQKVDIVEPDDEAAIQILQGIKEQYEAFHGVKYDSGVLPSIVKLSRRYLTEKYLPDKAIDLLDEAGAKAKINRKDAYVEIEKLKVELDILGKQKVEAVENQDFEKAARIRDEIDKVKGKLGSMSAKRRRVQVTYNVSVNDVAKVVSRMTGIPVTELDNVETDRLVNMEELLHKDIVGQDAAISAISGAVRRNKVGISNANRPLGSFIFLGPTGVGKTQLAKALAKFVFGKETAMLRVDMSDYNDKYTVSRLTGAAPGYVGYEEGGVLTNYVRQHPYSIILLDEVEKADASVFNILLQMLEEGQLSDKQGHVVNFRNTIIIMTSNVGSRSIVNQGRVGFGDMTLTTDEVKSAALGELKKLFTPEIINRIDEVIVFDPLTQDDVAKILDMQLAELAKRLSEKSYSITFSKEAKEYLAKKGYDPTMGARPMRRLIQKEVEDPLSKLLLDKTLSGMKAISVDLKDEKICATLLTQVVKTSRPLQKTRTKKVAK